MTRLAPLLVLGAFTLLACDAKFAAAPPPPPPPPAPPPLVPPVKSAMWNIASKTNRLAELLGKPPPLTGEDLQAARVLVDDVAKLAAGLGVDPVALKHPRVREGLPDFQRALVAAQAGLAKEPPDLAPAAGLASACLECHGAGKAAAPFEL